MMPSLEDWTYGAIWLAGAVLLASTIAFAQGIVGPSGAISILPAPLTVATLPACTATNKGALAQVSDATAPTYNAALTGSGAVIVPVYCNGTSWTSH